MNKVNIAQVCYYKKYITIMLEQSVLINIISSSVSQYAVGICLTYSILALR